MDAAGNLEVLCTGSVVLAGLMSSKLPGGLTSTVAFIFCMSTAHFVVLCVHGKPDGGH
jgi:hypothetical protein